MEAIFLTCMVIAFFFTKGKVDSAAYASGKEPPGVAKARMRHENGGGGRSPSGRPKGKGAFRLLLADRWANACESARQRGEHKARRRREWYETKVAPREDEAYKAKQLAKLEKADKARDRWSLSPMIDLSERLDRKAEDEAWRENERRDASAAETAGSTPVGHDPLRPVDAVELDQFAKQFSDVGRYADDRARASGGYDSALWYDAVRRIRDATIAEEAATAKESASDETAPAEFPLCVDPEDRFGGTVPLSKTHAELIDGKLPCWWEGGPSPARRPDTPCPEPRIPGYPFCREHIAEHNRMAAASGDASSVEEMVGKVAAVFSESDEPAAGTEHVEPEPAERAPEQGQASVLNTGTEGSSTVYEQAVIRLIAAADQVAEYRVDLAAFADTLDGNKWGAEVTGPILDMNGQLIALEGDYRDLAAQMKHQGDQGAAAHEQAPWVPADDSILA